MRLFISYAHVDKYLVQQVVEILRTGGHDPWFDHRLVVGKEWQAQLLDAIRQCDAFVYTLTPESVASEWCQWEFARAIELGKPIIPVLMQAKTPVPEALTAYQYADFSEGPTAEAVARLMGGLYSAMVTIPRENAPSAPENPSGRPAQAAPAPAPTPVEPAPANERDAPRISVTQSATNSKNVTQIGELHGNLTLNQGDSYAAPPKTPAASSGVSGKAATTQQIGQEPLPGEVMLYRQKAVRRFTLWSHTDCEVILTDKRLLFWDRESDRHSFRVSLGDLAGATFERKNDDLVIVLSNGQRYEIGLEKDEWQPLVDGIKEAAEAF